MNYVPTHPGYAAGHLRSRFCSSYTKMIQKCQTQVFGVFCFSFWNDDEFSSSGDKLIHAFSLLHVRMACLLLVLSFVLTPHTQAMRNVHQLHKLITLTFFTEPITN